MTGGSLVSCRNRRGELALRYLVFPLCIALAACGPYPQDISGTLDDIERTREFNVGLTDLRPADRAAALRFVGRLERATGAQAHVSTGPAEAQLARLETDRLDLVIGEFAEDTPWMQHVSMLEPLSRRAVGERVLGLVPATANGENRWIALIEREIRDSPKKAPPA